MPRIVGVRLRHRGQFYDFDARDLTLAPGDWVIVDTARGQDVGQVVWPPREVPTEQVPDALKPVERPATASDLRRMERSREREAESLTRARAMVADRNLPMRLVAAEYTYSGRSLTIYFSSENRVDFRELVKELAREFRARIELRQIGARDEARLLGGYGTCGRPLCCATFLNDFLRISVRMAKEQDLPLSPMKISGVCGRLLCCLSYEWEQYRQIKAELPVMGQEVSTLRGKGKVTAVNVPREAVTVEIRAGVSVEAGAAELARASQLEAEGQLPAGHPTYRGLVEALPAEEPAAGTLPPGPRGAEEEKQTHRRRRRRKKGESAAEAPAEKAPGPAARPAGGGRRETPRRQPERRKGPVRPPGPAASAPPAGTPPQQEARRRRPPRRRPPRDSS